MKRCRFWRLERTNTRSAVGLRGPEGSAPSRVQGRSLGGGQGGKAPGKFRLFVAKMLKVEQSRNDIFERILDPFKRQ